MKTFIWTVSNKQKTKFGYSFDVKVYRVVNNVPKYIGSKLDIRSGSMKGEQSEALSVLMTEKILPPSYEEKTGGYYVEKELTKLKIKFIGV
jgi:hypothetical protein